MRSSLWLVFLHFQTNDQSKTILVDCANQKAVHFVIGQALDPATTKERKLAEFSTLNTAQKIKQKVMAGQGVPTPVKLVTSLSPRGFAKEFGVKDVPIGH
jgi:hypothetical protein